MRIDRPDTSYRTVSLTFPLTFEIASQARVEQEVASPTWVNVVYPPGHPGDPVCRKPGFGLCARVQKSVDRGAALCR